MAAWDNASSEVVQIGSCGISTYLKSLPTASIVATNMIIIVLDSFLAVFAIITNSLFIQTYRTTRELQNMSNVLLVVLATSDILVGCLAQPLHIVRAVMEIYGSYDCALFNASRLVMIFCSGLSFWTIIVKTHDRYIAIFYPLHYTTMVTKKCIKVIFLACGVAVIALLVARVVLEMKTFFLVICGLTFYTITSAMVVYFRILLVARRQQARIRKTQPGIDSARRSRHPVIALHEIKTTRVMTYILGAMILCYLPGTCFWIYGNYHGYTKESLYTIVPFLETALFMNSAVNPVVYVLRSRKIRTAYIRNIKKILNGRLSP